MPAKKIINTIEKDKRISTQNLMSEICSTVCPVEEQCIGSCVRGIKDEPVQINYLERFINNWAKENNIEYKIETKNISNNTNKVYNRS